MKYQKEFESAINWPVKDLLSAVQVSHEVGESIAEHAMLSLMAGHVIDYEAEAESNDNQDWSSEISRFKKDMSESELKNYATAMDVICSVGIGILRGYRNSLREAGLMEHPLPDPDNVKVPDAADDIEWS